MIVTSYFSKILLDDYFPKHLLNITKENYYGKGLFY